MTSSAGECGNCKAVFEVHSPKITCIPSTWSNRKDNNHGPEMISVYEALSVVFEIPPLTPNNRGTSSSSPGVVTTTISSARLSKKEIFKHGSRFTKQFLQSSDENDDDDEDEEFEGGYALCSSCSEMLTVAYNSLQDFVAVCKLESDVGKILKELEGKELTLTQTKTRIRDKVEESVALKKYSAKPASVKRKEKEIIPAVVVKSEPGDVEDNDEDDGMEDDFLSQTGLASVMTSMAGDDSGGDDNGGDVSRPCSPDSSGSGKDVNFGKASTSRGSAKVQETKNIEDPPEPQRRSLRLRETTKRINLRENDISDDSDMEEENVKRQEKKKSNDFKATRLKHRIKKRPPSSDDEYVPPEDDIIKPKRKIFAVPFRSISQHNKVLLAQSISSPMKQLDCPKCGKQFLHENTLLCHRRLVHREDIALQRPTMNLSQFAVQKNNSVGQGTLSPVAGKTSTCPVCRLELPRNEIRIHLSSHTRSLSKPWLCTVCGVECSNQASLYNHHLNVHKRCVPCKRCETKIPKPEMIIHMRSCLKKQNGKSGDFTCKTCNQTFKSSLQLMEHRSRVHGHVWRCKICGNKFARRAKMIEHMQTHSRKKAFVCKICDKAYDRSDVLRLHVKRFHRNEGPPSVMKNAALETGDDDNSATEVTTQDDNNISQPTVSNAPASQNDVAAAQPIFEDRFICKPCDVPFRFFEELEEHLLELHTEKETSTCKICTRKFQDNYCLKLHLKVHSDTKQLICFMCSKSYKDKNTFFYHIKDVHKLNSQVIIAKYPDVFNVYTKNPNRRMVKKTERTTAPKRPVEKGEFPCEICGRIFSYLGGVERQIKVVHDKIRDFMCSYCGKGFSKKSFFQIHEKLHTTSDAPYKCHLCGKGFRLPGNLRMHLKSTIHNPSKDYVCEICGKGFNRMDNMKLHVKAVHMKIQIRKPRNRSGNSPPRSKRKLYPSESAESLQNPGPSRNQQQPHETKFDQESNSNTVGDASHHSSESNYQHNQQHQHHHQMPNLSMPNFDQPQTLGHNVENMYSHSQGDYSTTQAAALGFTFRGFQYK